MRKKLMTDTEYAENKALWLRWLAAFERVKVIFEKDIEANYICFYIADYNDGPSHCSIRRNAIDIMQDAAPNVKWFAGGWTISNKTGYTAKRRTVLIKTIAYIKNILNTDYKD